jgi:cyclopropane-fatty-acyl-phospholipid synthase
MTAHTIPNTAAPATAHQQWRWVDRLAKSILTRSLGQIQIGELRLADAIDTLAFGRTTPEFPTPIVVHVHQPHFYRSLLLGSSVAAGEAFVEDAWSCDDLVGLLRIALRNPEIFGAMEGLGSWAARLLHKAMHALRANTRANSRRNIAEHYDLGNAFYRLFLDDTMMYSSGIYSAAATTLEEASREKLERVCQKLRLIPSDSLLEIGTGWGGFSLHAARAFGCSIVTTTISHRQKELAEQRIRAAHLSDRVAVLAQDYRELQGQFDKLVSIEMIESVGHHYLDGFFAQCSRLLKPNGTMLLQAIVIGDQQYDRYRRSADFIQRYIFPGGCLPSIARICGCVARMTDLRVIHLEDFTEDYARTLADWRKRFLANLDAVRELGYSQAFIRMWEYYLCYCEAGFRERNIGLVQIVLAKPGYRSP